jgi:hypothetical protein
MVQVTLAANNFKESKQGSLPKVVVSAASWQLDLPTHAFDTTCTDDLALQLALTANPVLHEPEGRPKLAKSTDLMMPAPQSRVSVSFSSTIPQFGVAGMVHSHAAATLPSAVRHDVWW